MSSPSPITPPARKARHLMDLDAPRPVRNSAAAEASLAHVKQWIMSALVVVTISHLCVGLILLAIFLPDPTLSSQVGLNLIASAFEMVAIAAALAIHTKPLLSPWLLLGLAPGAVGLFLTLH